MSLERLDPNNRADVNAVADLHQAFLGNSPVVQLGPRFLRDFYYAKLVASGLVVCTIGKAEGRVVGFISYTRYAADFMGRGIRRHGLYLAWVLLGSVLRRPALLGEMLRAMRLMRHRDRVLPNVAPETLGEGLTMVVLPQYQTHIPAGGTGRLPVRLFESMVEYFQREGIEQVQLMVQPDNLASNLFWSSRGCRFEKVRMGNRWIHLYLYSVPPRQQHDSASTRT